MNVDILFNYEFSSWARKLSPEAVWNTCERGDWLFLLLSKSSVSCRDVATAACSCAEFGLQDREVSYPGDLRLRRWLAVGWAWLAGNATYDDVKSSYDEAVSVHNAEVEPSIRAVVMALGTCLTAGCGATSEDRFPQKNLYNSAVFASHTANAIHVKHGRECADEVRKRWSRLPVSGDAYARMPRSWAPGAL